MTSSSAGPQRIISDAEIERRFNYHPPSTDQVERCSEITSRCIEMAKRIRDLTPAGREQSLALTALEDVRMRANQAIATGE
jgi:hypothetical protein